jgi:SRSO17 transposase
MEWNQKLWQRSVGQFAEFLESLAAGLGRRERREGAALYVQGLLMPGERNPSNRWPSGWGLIVRSSSG